MACKVVEVKCSFFFPLRIHLTIIPFLLVEPSYQCENQSIV
jgi:hypothetical protein